MAAGGGMVYWTQHIESDFETLKKFHKGNFGDSKVI